jgi:hypothetical protein
VAEVRAKKQDEKDRKDRDEKRQRLAGGKVNNPQRLRHAVKVITLAVAGIVAMAAMLLVTVRSFDTTPQVALELLLADVVRVVRAYGVLAGLALTGAFAARAGFTSAWTWWQHYTAEQEAAMASLQRATAARAKAIATKEKLLADAAEQQKLDALAAAQVEALDQQRRQAAAARVVAEAELARQMSQAARWEPGEQTLLEAALAACPVEQLPSDDAIWAFVAERVPGRSGVECRTRHHWVLRAAAAAAVGAGHKHHQPTVRQGPGTAYEPADEFNYDNYTDEDSESNDEDSGDGSDGDEQAHAGNATKRTPLAPELEPAAQGTRCTLQGILLWNIGTLQPISVKLQTTCTACGVRQHDVTLSGGFVEEASARVWCGCGQLLGATLRPALVHAGSNVLWHADLVFLRIVDVLGTTVRASCITCLEPIDMPLQRGGTRSEVSCRGCHAKLAVAAKSAVLDVLSAGTGGSAAGNSGLTERLAAKRATQARDTQGIVSGRPLPNNGACMHFTKSGCYDLIRQFSLTEPVFVCF